MGVSKPWPLPGTLGILMHLHFGRAAGFGDGRGRFRLGMRPTWRTQVESDGGGTWPLVDRMMRAQHVDWPRLLLGLATGRREDMAYAERQAFSQLGLAHLTAVSGFHVGLWLWMSMAALTWVPIRWRMLACQPGIWGYVGLCGAPNSALRAACMAGLVALAVATGRKLDAWRSLTVAAGALWIHGTRSGSRRGNTAQFPGHSWHPALEPTAPSKLARTIVARHTVGGHREYGARGPHVWPVPCGILARQSSGFPCGDGVDVAVGRQSGLAFLHGWGKHGHCPVALRRGGPWSAVGIRGVPPFGFLWMGTGSRWPVWSSLLGRWWDCVPGVGLGWVSAWSWPSPCCVGSRAAIEICKWSRCPNQATWWCPNGVGSALCPRVQMATA